MILADTSVWIEHFLGRDSELADNLVQKKIILHPMVLGELSLGGLPKKTGIFHLLRLMRQVPAATDREVLNFVDFNRLSGAGIGWVDAHLLVACRLHNHLLWTHDKRLSLAARSCGVKLKTPASDNE